MPNRYQQDVDGKWRCNPGEAYAQSLAGLEQVVKPSFPNFNIIVVRKNTTSSNQTSLEEELAGIRQKQTTVYGG